MSDTAPVVPHAAVEFVDLEPEPLWTFAYASEPTRAMSDADLRRLHLSAERNNERDGLTGRLVVVEAGGQTTHFVQYLEGPRAELKACARRIFADGRHGDIVVFQSAALAERRFGQWSMHYEVTDRSELDADIAAALWRISEEAAAGPTDGSPLSLEDVAG